MAQLQTYNKNTHQQRGNCEWWLASWSIGNTYPFRFGLMVSFNAQTIISPGFINTFLMACAVIVVFDFTFIDICSGKVHFKVNKK